jgi:hypothetical protein
MAMGSYVLVMLFWKRLLDCVDATWLQVAGALFPALLVCWVMRAFVATCATPTRCSGASSWSPARSPRCWCRAVYLGRASCRAPS